MQLLSLQEGCCEDYINIKQKAFRTQLGTQLTLSVRYHDARSSHKSATPVVLRLVQRTPRVPEILPGGFMRSKFSKSTKKLAAFITPSLTNVQWSFFWWWHWNRLNTEAARNLARCYQDCKNVKHANLLSKYVCVLRKVIFHKNHVKCNEFIIISKGFYKILSA